eukprot:TRINITY_DN5046_c0_g1_i1.p1 TRINITY_DN5046_c0_g1~~TRINITY_DN5046_c0_g1_i1.p1  ORF type:complete len:700 (-),score=119.45 TRINITY_DN5046_c0_g1_i1:95-2194(-)
MRNISMHCLCLIALLYLLTFASATCVDGLPDGIYDPSEGCDAGLNGVGCTNQCEVEVGYFCTTPITGETSVCQILCGDGIKMPSEECDDGRVPGIGCKNCRVAEGYTCFDERKNLANQLITSRCVENCPTCSTEQYLVSPCISGVPVRCERCKTCSDRQAETSPCTSSHDRVCACLPGTSLTPSGDCVRPAEVPQTCDWQEWGQWGECGLCGGVKTRSRNAGPLASPACPTTFLDSAVCTTECAGLSFDQEKEISDQYQSGTAGYGALSLYAFWSGEGASLILGKYGLKLRLSQDPEGDALNGKFLLSFIDPDTNSTCDENSEAVVEAYAEVAEVTTRFLVDRRNIELQNVNPTLDGCDVQVQIMDAKDDRWIAAAVVVPILVILILGALAFVYWNKNKPLSLKHLPPSIRWQYEKFQGNPDKWKQIGVGSGSYYHKKLDFQGEEFDHLSKIFYGYQGASQDFPIKDAYAVYNPLLISNFINQLEILRARFQKNPEIFKTSRWMLEDSASKVQVNDFYSARSKALEWNNNTDEVPILVALHGTDFTVAKSICSTGFASLSLLDGGWYGRGIYFSTFANYCETYFQNRRDPALIISYVISGNAFPVTEHHKGEGSLLGAAITSGYTSHYAVVKLDGSTPSASELENKKIPLFDEIVIPQESQIMPAYVLRLDTDKKVANLNRSASAKKSRKSKKEKAVLL